jgi:hypothetical protein
MKRLVSTTLCSVAAAAFSLPAAAADESTAKNRAGANASVEGGVALGGTGVSGGASAQTGDTQARRDNKEEDKRKQRAQRKKEVDASTGASASGSIKY